MSSNPTKTSLGLAFFLLIPMVAASSQPPSLPASTRIDYRNTLYDFCISLPEDWKGYSIIADQWEGSLYSPQRGYHDHRSGPMITIRSPQWTALKPFQDIPIMIFTHAQWKLVRKENLVVSAAPFPPGEIGRNSKYVFALQPRYIHGDLPGTQEVYKLMKAKPFHAPCKQ